MRKGIFATVAVLATLFTAAPAVADAPDVYELTRTMDGEVDPCTGEIVTVDFVWTVYEHQHSNNQVTRFDGVAVASNGGVANGTETQVINKKWLTTTFNWVNVNDATGNRHLVKGRVKIDLETGDFVKFDVDNFQCLGNN